MSVPSPEPLRKFVRAGAGAGKTYNLTREVVKLALQFRDDTGQWPRTVLTTFTRKATQELKERMLLYCLTEKPEALEFVQSTSYLNITTMHGLLNGFLSRFGFGVGLPNQIKIVDSQQALFWRKQILRQMISDYKNSESLQLFNFQTLLEHLQAYESIYWSGGHRPLQKHEDFEFVYTQWMLKKSHDVKARMDLVKELGLDDRWQPYFEHFDSLQRCMQQPKPWQQWRLELAGHWPLPKKPRASKDNPGIPDSIKKPYDSFFTKLKSQIEDVDLSPEYWDKTIKVLSDFQQFADEFVNKLADKKKSEGALEPNDLEFFALKIQRERPELIQRFSAEVDAWFIDEFQDTSPLQMRLLEPMIGNSSCYIVGDPQQSIYLFRGSRSEVFFDKSQKMQEEGADMTPLEDNYRSQENLLQFFNSIFPSLRRSFSPMNPMVVAENDHPAVQITHVKAEESDAELHHLTEELSGLINRGVLAKDICVLTRTHKKSDELQKTLMALGFPVISHSSDQFYERREVIDGLALLKFLVNPWDDRNLLTLFRSPWVGLSDQEIVTVLGESEKNFWPLFLKHFETNKPQGPCRSLLESRRQIESMGYAWVFRRLLIQLGMLDYTYQVDTTGRREANLWKLINVVERNAREPGSSLLQLIQLGHRSSSLENFGDGGDASSPVEPNKIHLMTVHASKGLQFDYVFIPFMEKKGRVSTWNRFSSDSDIDFWSLRMPLSDTSKEHGGALEKLIVETTQEKEMEESLRVFYVATTRARKQLFLSWSGQPETLSWAEELMSCEAQWRSNRHVTFKEVESQKAHAFHENLGADQVPEPFTNVVQRFGWESSLQETVDFKTPSASWDSIVTGQKRRRDGVILHRVFESLKWHSLEETKRYCRGWLPGRDQEMEAAVDFLYQQSDVPLSEIIRQGFVEWGYQRQSSDGSQIERRIDLWGVVDQILWVVDYKTGAEAYRDQAFQQMSEYADTLKSYLNWQQDIRMVAVYPFSNKLFVKTY